MTAGQPDRPTQAQSLNHRLLTAGNISVDLDSYRASVDGIVVELTYQEFELLRQLVAQPGRIIPYDDLLLSRWNSTGRQELRRLGVLVCRLRNKLKGSWPYRIQTVRRRGYGLVASAES